MTDIGTAAAAVGSYRWYAGGRRRGSVRRPARKAGSVTGIQ